MSRTRIAGAAAVLAAALAVTAAAAAGPGKGKQAAMPMLTGTWTTTIWLDNPPPGIDATFQALDTFVAGGGILVSSSQSHAPTRSLAQGNCAHTSGARFSCTFVWFRFDPAGTFVGLQRVRRTMTVTGDSFSAKDTVEVLDPSGTVVASLQAKETGQRLAS